MISSNHPSQSVSILTNIEKQITTMEKNITSYKITI